MDISKTLQTIIKKHEGGYVNHPADKGGPTHMGITLDTLKSYLGFSCNEKTLKAMSLDLAIKIYRERYYYTPKIHMLPEIIQPLVLDMSINHGPKKAVLILQDELQRGGYSVGHIDGIIGGKTAKASQHAIDDHDRLYLDFLVNRRLKFYHAIVENNPSQSVFLNGWIKRANSFRPEHIECYL